MATSSQKKAPNCAWRRVERGSAEGAPYAIHQCDSCGRVHAWIRSETGPTFYTEPMLEHYKAAS